MQRVRLLHSLLWFRHQQPCRPQADCHAPTAAARRWGGSERIGPATPCHCRHCCECEPTRHQRRLGAASLCSRSLCIGTPPALLRCLTVGRISGGVEWRRRARACRSRALAAGTSARCLPTRSRLPLAVIRFALSVHLTASILPAHCSPEALPSDATLAALIDCHLFGLVPFLAVSSFSWSSSRAREAAPTAAKRSESNALANIGQLQVSGCSEAKADCRPMRDRLDR